MNKKRLIEFLNNTSDNVLLENFYDADMLKNRSKFEIQYLYERFTYDEIKEYIANRKAEESTGLTITEKHLLDETEDRVLIEYFLLNSNMEQTYPGFSSLAFQTYFWNRLTWDDIERYEEEKEEEKTELFERTKLQLIETLNEAVFSLEISDDEEFSSIIEPLVEEIEECLDFYENGKT